MKPNEPVGETLSAADLARADAALASVLSSDVPRPWPTAPSLEPRMIRPPRIGSRHLALAASIALLALGLVFAASFSAKPKDAHGLPSGAGPATAKKPAGISRPAR